MDKDGNGTLSFEEIEAGLKDMANENWESILESLREADTDKSGEIDYTEFIAATLDS